MLARSLPPADTVRRPRRLPTRSPRWTVADHDVYWSVRIHLYAHSGLLCGYRARGDRVARYLVDGTQFQPCFAYLLFRFREGRADEVRDLDGLPAFFGVGGALGFLLHLRLVGARLLLHALIRSYQAPHQDGGHQQDQQ